MATKPRFGLFPLPYDTNGKNLIQIGELMLDRETADLYTMNSKKKIISKTYDLGVLCKKIEDQLRRNTNSLLFLADDMKNNFKIEYNNGADKDNNYGFPYLITTHGIKINGVHLNDFYFNVNLYDKIIFKVQFVVYSKSLASHYNVISKDPLNVNLLCSMDTEEYAIDRVKSGSSNYTLCGDINQMDYSTGTAQTVSLYEYTQTFTIDSSPKNIKNNTILNFYESNYIKSALFYLTCKDVSSVLGSDGELRIYSVSVIRDTNSSEQFKNSPLIIDTNRIKDCPQLINMGRDVSLSNGVISTNTLEINIFNTNLKPGIYSMTLVLSSYSSNITIGKSSETVDKTGSNSISFTNIGTIEPSKKSYISNIGRVITTTIPIDSNTKKIILKSTGNTNYTQIKLDLITTASFDDCGIV